jgi:hypothetical protein
MAASEAFALFLGLLIGMPLGALTFFLGAFAASKFLERAGATDDHT